MKNFLLKLKNRIIENFKKNRLFLLIFLIAWVTYAFVVINQYDATLGMKSIGNEVYERYVTEIDNNTVIEQIVPIEQDGESVSIMFATYARKNAGSVNIIIKGDKSNHIYADNTYPVDMIEDNAYLTIKLDEKLNKAKDPKIRITITSNSETDKAIGIYHSVLDGFENSKLTINKKEVEDSDLSMKYLVRNDKMRNFSTGVLIYAFIVITLIALVLLLVDPPKEVFFTIMILGLGLLMMLIINPSSPPDELSHYEIAMQLSNKMMFQKDYRAIDYTYIRYGSMYGHYNIAAGYERFIDEINKPLKLTGKIEYLARDIGELYIPQYIPNAIGLTLGRILKLNMLTTFYLGRLTGFIFYLVCVYFAIKKASSYKFLIGMIASLPMLLQISIAITYDAYIQALCILLFGYYINWYFSDEQIKIKDYIVVAIVCNLLAPAKIVYGMLAFLFALIPARKYGGMKNKLIMIALMCITIIAQLFDIMYKPIELFFKMLFSASLTKDNLLDASEFVKLRTFIDNEINPIINTFIAPDMFRYSFHYMFKHPWEVLDIFYRTVRYRIKFWFYGAIGRSLSGETLILPLASVHALTIIILGSAFVAVEKVFPPIVKVAFVALCIIIGLFTMIGMFVSWTDSGQEIVEDYGGVIIEGVQGRYFSPILPFFFSIFPNKKFSLPEKSDKFFILAYLLLFFFIVVYVLSYTFVN